MLPPSTVTFLFTDIEGSTERWELDRSAMQAALAHHDALLSESIAQHGGQVFKTIGDAFCAAFVSAASALQAAVDAQLALAATDWGRFGDGFAPLLVRMALHSGQAEERDGDYFGPPLNRVARLLGVGHGGQILLSQTAARIAEDALPEGVALVDLGRHRLRDLGGRRRVFEARHIASREDAPALRSVIRVPSNLPEPRTTFVGRLDEIRLTEQLLEDRRLVTLTGAGGSGKTTLALHVARDARDSHPDGVWLVTLAGVDDPAMVAQAVGTVLGLREQPHRKWPELLTEHLRRSRTLLVLDNCEHVLDGCAPLVHELLDRCERLRVLCTSREALGISGEQTMLVGALPAPPVDASTVEEVAAFDSVALFASRAASVKPGFVVDEDNAAVVAELCRRLDGLPLALELAAARTRMMTPAQILERLDKRFRLLTGGDRTGLPHHQTLAATLDWSHDLLDEQERALFARLGVFAGGWTLESAEAVCADGTIEDWEVIDWLSRLVDKSLVQVDREATRYGMLESVRVYAVSRLAARHERAQVMAAHRAHYTALAEEAAGHPTGRQSEVWLARLVAEHDNLRAVMSRAMNAEEPEVVLSVGGALWRFWYRRGHLSEGRRRLAEAAIATEKSANGSSPEVWGRALHGQGTLAIYQGDFDDAHGLLTRALENWQAVGNESGEASALHNLAIIDHERGRYGKARSLLEQMLTITPDDPGRARTLANLGLCALELGDLSGATELFAQAKTLDESGDHGDAPAHHLFNQASVVQAAGDLGEAQRLFELCLVQAREREDRLTESATLGNLAEIASHRGNLLIARGMLEDVLERETDLDDRRGKALTLRRQGELEWIAGDPTAARGPLLASLKLLTTVGQNRETATVESLLGLIDGAEGDLSSGARRVLRGLELRIEMESPLKIAESLEASSELLAEAGQAEKSLACILLAAATRKELQAPPPPYRSSALTSIEQDLRARIGPNPSAEVESAAMAWTLEQAIVHCREALEGLVDEPANEGDAKAGD